MCLYIYLLYVTYIYYIFIYIFLQIYNIYFTYYTFYMYLLHIFITYTYFPFYLKLKLTSSQNLTFGVLISGLQLFLVMRGSRARSSHTYSTAEGLSPQTGARSLAPQHRKRPRWVKCFCNCHEEKERAQGDSSAQGRSPFLVII